MKPLFKQRLAAAVLMAAVSGGVAAQETSSAFRGTVATESGGAIAGAQVTVIDTRTGSTKEVTTGANGKFSLKGLRVGGPYTLVVEGSEGTKTIEGFYLTLGEPLDVNVEVASESIETVTVVADASSLTYESRGPSVAFGFEDIQFQPSVNRDIKDIISTDPRISIDITNSDSIECAGVNNRFNSLTVDGIKQNDNFGLNNNGFPTERLPFPYDAIDQVAVELAPFDVQYGGFTGCNINAVVKSGTNEFHGNVFYDYTDNSLRSDELAELGDEGRFGFTLGGPIIQDKLFFFVAYEEHDPSGLVEEGPTDAGFSNDVRDLTTADVEEIRSIAQEVYGYTAGDIVTALQEKEEKILAKIDWEITNSQRAAFTYQNTDGNTIATSGVSPFGFALTDRYYERANELTTYSLQVYSDWTDNFSTELRLGFAEVENGQVPGTSNTSFGDIEIEDGNGDAAGSPDVFLGADQFRQANELNYDTTSFKFAGTYLAGSHEITGGIEYEEVDVFNLFVPGSQGVFRFANVEDFRNQQAEAISYSIPGSLDVNDGAAEFAFETTTLYIQDKWYATDDLTLTFGLRYDSYGSDSDPIANDNFERRYGFSNAQGPDFDLIQPRFGINYEATENLTFYGGIGLFSGGNPNVWLSNNYSNNGVSILDSDVDLDDARFGRTFTAEELAALDGTNTENFGLEVPAYFVDNLVGGDGSVNALDPDFEVPSLWKFSAGFNIVLKYDVEVGVDLIHTQQQDAPATIALNTVQIGTAPDGRPIYRNVDLLLEACQNDPTDAANCEGRSGTDYLLTNTDNNGKSTIVSLFAKKHFESGFSISGGYTAQDAEEASPHNSSTAGSNFGNLSVRNINDPEVGTSNYETEHRFVLSLGYRNAFFGDYETGINLFLQRQSGQHFSYTFEGDPGFGDARGFEDRNLLYVPAGPGANDDALVEYVPLGVDEDGNQVGFDLDAFNAFVESRGLSRGQIQARNAENSRWWSRADLKITQEIPGFSPEHRGQFFINIFNVGNLLNDEWGVLQQVNFEFNNPVVEAEVVDNGDGTTSYLYTNFNEPASESINSEASYWSVRAGVQYTF